MHNTFQSSQIHTIFLTDDMHTIFLTDNKSSNTIINQTTQLNSKPNKAIQ